MHLHIWIIYSLLSDPGASGRERVSGVRHLWALWGKWKIPPDPVNLDRSVLLLLPGCLCSHLYNLFFTCQKTSPLPTGMWGVPLKSHSRPALGRALRDVRLSPLSWADGSTQAVNRLSRAANAFLPPPSQLSRAGFPKMSLHGDLHPPAQQKGLQSGPRRVKKKKKWAYKCGAGHALLVFFPLTQGIQASAWQFETQATTSL